MADPKSPPKPDKPKKAKLPKHVVRLQDADKNTLRFTARQAENGSATSFITHTVKGEDGRNHSKRGGTEKHANFEAAKNTVDSGVSRASKMGWVPRAKRVGKDAFNLDSLPTPKK